MYTGECDQPEVYVKEAKVSILGGPTRIITVTVPVFLITVVRSFLLELSFSAGNTVLKVFYHEVLISRCFSFIPLIITTNEYFKIQK